MLVIAKQKPGVLESYQITRDHADRAVQAIDAGGHRFEGAAAINRVVEEVGGVWRLLAAPHRIPPIAALEEAAYRWFAPRRSRFRRFGVTPECDELEAGCE